MEPRHIRSSIPGGLALLVALLSPAASLAQSQTQGATPGAQPRGGTAHRLGIEAFGGASVSWPTAADSFDAAGLESRQTHFGGGARVTGIWRDLFGEVAVTRWSDTGERVFIDSTGERFPLGIPLSVKATYVDLSAGWKVPAVTRSGRTSLLSYFGAGAGVVLYEESSPFAEAGEDVDTRATSYHAFLGVEVPIVRWLAVAVDGRYRYVPDVLGAGGISAAVGDDDSLGGMQMSVSLRVGFGRGSRPTAPTPGPGSSPGPGKPFVDPPQPPAAAGATTGTIVGTAPVYLLPDAQRIPLRQLAEGTTVRVLARDGDWVRVEFSDPQYGPRVGYVESRFIRIRNPE